jgi:hypothetical protein
MPAHRTIRRSVIPRLEAERRWQELYQLLLEMGSEPPRPVPTADDPTVGGATRLEGPHESRCRCARRNPTTGRGFNHCATDRTPPGLGPDGGLDARGRPCIPR